MNKSGRGFTLVELTVALSMILLVSLTVMSIISYQLQVQNATIRTVKATNIAENAIECFRYSQKNGCDFADVFGHTGYTLTAVSDEATAYCVIADGVTVTIRITENRIAVTAEGPKGGEILSRVYETPEGDGI